MLKGLFSKTHDLKPASVTPVVGALPRLTPKELLLPYTANLNKIEELAGLPREFYRRYYETSFHNYAEFVQQLPASETHHHSAHGGMLRHGLEVAMTALKLRGAHLLPAGANTGRDHAKAGPLDLCHIFRGFVSRPCETGDRSIRNAVRFRRKLLAMDSLDRRNAGFGPMVPNEI